MPVLRKCHPTVFDMESIVSSIYSKTSNGTPYIKKEAFAKNVDNIVTTNSILVSEEENEDKNNKNKFCLLAQYKLVATLCLLVAFGGFIFGWDTGTISGFVQMPSFKNLFGTYNKFTGVYEFTNSRVGLIISIFNLGCALGGVTLAKLGDKLGRKRGLMAVIVVYIIGIVTQISAMHWLQFMSGRIVSGLAVGAVSVLSPMFIAETSPSKIRGILVSCYQLLITLGILLGYITTFVTVHTFSDTRQWRIPLGLCFVWAIILFGGMVFLPESPRFLIEKERMAEATESIARVNSLEVSDTRVIAELYEISVGIKKQREAGEASWSELVFGKPHILTRLMIGVSLQSFQQLTGNNYFFYYGTTIFQSVGLEDSFLTSIILGAVNFGSTFVALYVVGRIGRRTNLITGSLGMAICLLIFAVIGSTILYPNGYGMPINRLAGIGLVVLTCIFIFLFAITWAPGAFIVVSETYPLRIRSRGMAIATAANWVWGFLIAFFTPAITSHIRFAYGFVFFGATVVGGFFVYFMVPETENLSLEEVDVLYRYYQPFNARNARKTIQCFHGEEKHMGP